MYQPAVAPATPVEAGEVLVYEGGHAATMRHDSAERGIPRPCIERIARHLGSR